jgi:hypothetical protein
LGQANAAAAPPVDPVKDIFDGRTFSESPQLARQILLQGLAAPLCPASQRRMNLFRDIPYQQVRHAFIMLSAASRGQSTR